ncbi:MAG: OmpA family protein [Gammaproteobacteria bacterium]
MKKLKLSTGRQPAPVHERRALRLEAADPRGLPTIILFPRDSAKLSRSYREALQRHVLYLQAFEQKAVFVLRGHANLRTNETGAVSLSRRRAATVSDCLLQLGVAKKNIKMLAKGSEQSWDLEMGGAVPLGWNRRVEITMVIRKPKKQAARALK